MSQLILQLFCRFTYVTAHSPTLLSLYLCQSSFSNPSVALPTSQLIFQPFCGFTYVTAHSPTLLSLYLHPCSFSNPSLALPTSQLILQPFHCFTYLTVHSSTLLSLILRHKLFTYVTWRAAPVYYGVYFDCIYKVKKPLHGKCSANKDNILIAFRREVAQISE